MFGVEISIASLAVVRMYNDVVLIESFPVDEVFVAALTTVVGSDLEAYLHCV